MTIPGVSATPAELPDNEERIADPGNRGSMSRQDVWDFHGHEMHPQQFVRLIGSLDLNARTHGAVRRLH